MTTPSESKMGDELTEDQRFALHWVTHFPATRMRWLRGGKPAYGTPDKWDAIEFSGKRGSIIIAAADWEAILPFKALHPDGPRAPSVYVLNDLGRASLGAKP